MRRIRAGERDPKLDGYLWQGKQYEGGMVNVLEALWANGARLLDEAGRSFPEPERARESLAFLRGLIESGVSPAWVTAADEELTRRPFGDGRAIFLRGWPYALDLFELPDSRVRGKVGVAPIPRLRHGPVGAASTGGAHLAVSARTRHRDLAVALARFLTGEDAQRAMTEGAALRPSRPALYRDAALIARDPSLPALYGLMLRGHPRPITPYYLMLSTTLQPEFSAVLVGRKSPERAMRDAAAQIEHLLRSVTPRERPRPGRWLLLVTGRLLVLGDAHVYPALWVLWLALQYRVPVFGISRWAGLEHFAFLAVDTRFWNAAWVTGVFTVTSVALEGALGLAIAVALRGQRGGRRIALALLLLAWALPSVVTAKMFEWLYHPAGGLVNFVLGGRPSTGSAIRPWPCRR